MAADTHSVGGGLQKDPCSGPTRMEIRDLLPLAIYFESLHQI